MRRKYALIAGLALLVSVFTMSAPAYAAVSSSYAAADDLPAATPSPTPTAVPAPVTNVQWEYHSSTSVDLFWNGSTDSTVQYRVVVNSNFEGKKSTASYNVTDTHLTIMNVLPGSEFDAVVTAYNNVGSATGATPAVQWSQPATIPGEPQSVKLENLTSPKAKISWKVPAADGGSSLLTYTVSVFTLSDKRVYWVSSVTASHLSEMIPMLQGSTSYYATVTAVNSHGTSAAARSNTITTPVAVVTPVQSPTPVPTVTQTVTVPTPSATAPVQVKPTQQPSSPSVQPVQTTQQPTMINWNTIVLVLLFAGLAAAITALVIVVHLDNKRLRDEDRGHDDEL